MRPIQRTPLSQEELAVLHGLYRTTKDVRLCTRAQMILLTAEQGMSAPAVAKIVHEHEQTVRKWFKRYEAEGAEGLKDAPRPGSPRQVTPEYRTQLAEVVRMRPRSLGCPTPSGPWHAWLTIWLSKPAFASKWRRCALT